MVKKKYRSSPPGPTRSGGLAREVLLLLLLQLRHLHELLLDELSKVNAKLFPVALEKLLRGGLAQV